MPKKEKVLEISQSVKAMAEKVIAEEGLDLVGATIEYLLVHPSISDTVAGRCIRSNRELNFFTKLNYIIEMSGELWNSLDEKTQYILTFHELLHINPVINARTGEVVYKLIDHDVKDFMRIIEKYGIDWFKTLKTHMSSVYELEPKDERSIRL